MVFHVTELIEERRARPSLSQLIKRMVPRDYATYVVYRGKVWR